MKLGRLFQGGKVAAEEARIATFQKDRNVAGLIEMLDSDVRGVTKYSIVRGDAAMALGRIGDPRIIPHLVKMRHDPEAMVRWDVARALGRLKTKEAEGPLREFLADPAPIVRMRAASALAGMAAVDAVPLLRALVDTDPNREVRLHAVEALLILGDETARDRVPEVLSAIPRRVRAHPRWKRLRETVEAGEKLTPWTRDEAWE